MAANKATIICRTAVDEKEDTRQIFENYEKEEWRSWPNNGAFDGLEEHRGPIVLKVKGSIPSWAAGTLYRTGPGQSEVENTSRGTHHVSHWFDGFAHTHRFDIIPSVQDGNQCTVTYYSRRQSEEYIQMVKEKGWRVDISFGQRNDPCIGIFAKFMSLFTPRQVNNNVAVLPNLPGLERKHSVSSSYWTEPKNVYTSTDNATLQKLDPNTLEPVGTATQKDLHPDLKGPMSCAHAQRDPETGDLFNFNLDMGRIGTYRVFRVNADTGTTDILATVRDKELVPAYIHSFFLTQNHVILCVPTSHLGWNGLKVLWERNIIEAIKPFNKKERCKWLVIDRREGRGVVAKFSTPASFFFHSVNAFEEKSKDEHGNEVTNFYMDYVKYANTDIMHFLYYDILKGQNGAATNGLGERGGYKSAQTHLVRHKFTMHALPQENCGSSAYAQPAEEMFSIPGPHSGELPTINPNRAGKAYRYVYGVSSQGRNIFMDSLVKTDLENRKALIWNGPIGHTPGEPIFVPRPGGTKEDDGVILTLVLDGSAQESYLLCLDAQTLEELGRAETSFPIALGLHGSHVSSVEKSAL
ncbi:hypothetical protein QQS21_005068 [Conoideocrella luteorostrata]|uniref:Carotenoid cleavage dioxygenase 1 n=1 Tax=Conoideocrella luteorostrata TaxID=1105319 RepID=A0AAJ0FUV0_9HYPO|nr:hypothetical protein QQS21_005068 [Conoideocrella luteorostrata]